MNPICLQDLTPAKVLAAPTNCQLTADLEIGTANPSTAYDVFIIHNGSKKVLKYDIVSSVSGMLTIDLTVNPLSFNNITTRNRSGGTPRCSFHQIRPTIWFTI